MEASNNGIRLDEATSVTAHRDLGTINPTELDGITINRTKSKIDPFVEIRKEWLVDKLTGAPSDCRVGAGTLRSSIRLWGLIWPILSQTHVDV